MYDSKANRNSDSCFAFSRVYSAADEIYHIYDDQFMTKFKTY